MNICHAFEDRSLSVDWNRLYSFLVSFHFFEPSTVVDRAIYVVLGSPLSLKTVDFHLDPYSFKVSAERGDLESSRNVMVRRSLEFKLIFDE